MKYLTDFVSKDFSITIINVLGSLFGALLGGLFAFLIARYTIENQYRKQARLEMIKLKFNFEIDNLDNLETILRKITPLSDKFRTLYTEIVSFYDNNQTNSYIKLQQKNKSDLKNDIEAMKNFQSEANSIVREWLEIQQKIKSCSEMTDNINLKKAIISYINYDPGFFDSNIPFIKLAKVLELELKKKSFFDLEPFSMINLDILRHINNSTRNFRESKLKSIRKEMLTEYAKKI